MGPLSTLLAWSVRNAPPVAVPDARRHLAVYCVEACDSTGDLELELDRRARKRRRLPRAASTAAYTVDVLPIGAYGTSAPDSTEFLLVTFAGPTAGAERRRVAWDAEVAAWARAEGGLIHDLDTGRIEDAEAFTARQHLVDFVGLQWDEDRVVTRGLRALGLHELVVEGVPEALAGEVSTVLVWLAADMLDEPGPYETRTLGLDDLDQDLVIWIAQSIWYEDDPGVIEAGSRQGTVRLSNATPRSHDPAPPLLEVDLGDMPTWLDETLGRGTLEETPWEDPVSD